MSTRPCRDCGYVLEPKMRGCPRCALNLEAESVYGENVMTSDGVIAGDGTVFCSASVLFGDGVIAGDGQMIGDGVIAGDSRGVIAGDVGPTGDDTACRPAVRDGTF